jgi:hypothetical protein
MNLLYFYSSVIEAEKTTGINSISAVCRGERKTAGGFVWKYKEKEGVL